MDVSRIARQGNLGHLSKHHDGCCDAAIIIGSTLARRRPVSDPAKHLGAGPITTIPPTQQALTP
jgi:hypothetical protein